MPFPDNQEADPETLLMPSVKHRQGLEVKEGEDPQSEQNDDS